MADREVDQQLVERAQRGDKRAFELLVLKYQRKLGRLLSRLVRDPGEVEDVTQEAFIKAYRALPSFRGDSAFYTWLYRIAINTAKNYLVAMGRRAPTSTGFDHEEAENFEDAEQLRDSATPEDELHGKQIANTVNKAMEALPEDLRTEISLLVDGELDVERIEGVCTRLRDADSVTTWVCYHVIGDALRGSSAIMPGFAARFATRLAAEPTVLSPPRRGPAPAAIAWAAA